MIGTHDTFSYLKAVNPLYNIPIVRRTWQTQNMPIEVQYSWGVRFFDVRVVRHDGEWHFAHGLARFEGEEYYVRNTILTIDELFRAWFPKAFYRIVLERGGTAEEELFIDQVKSVGAMENSNMWLADIKSHKKWDGEVVNNSGRIAKRGYKFALAPNTWTMPSYELHGTVTWRNFYKVSLLDRARSINALAGLKDKYLMKLMKEDKDSLYLLDFPNEH